MGQAAHTGDMRSIRERTTWQTRTH